MVNRLIKFVEGEFYHLYNRGNDKRIIFNDDQDRDYFKRLLLLMNTNSRVKVRDVDNFDSKNEEITNLVSICVYCLMDNHFHILVKQEYENGVSLFMQKISTAYVMYYNKKYKRTGSLFEGVFKSKYISGDNYLKYLFSYIHLNPLKMINPSWKAVKLKPEESLLFLKNYRYSSFINYYLNDFSDGILNKDASPEYFLTDKEFISFIFRWISIKAEN